MKRFWIAVPLLLVFAAAAALAQDKSVGDPTALAPSISPSEVKATPEMWFYEQQLREYLDPAKAVRRKAEFRSAQRQRRMAALKWFGFSNQRPVASPDPFNGDYSPGWTSNNHMHPSWWNGYGQPWVAGRPRGSTPLY